MPRSAVKAPTPDHASVADDVLGLVAATVPGYQVTAERREAMQQLLRTLVRTLALEHDG